MVAMLSFSEHLIMDRFGYAYGIAVADLDGDGHPDISAADADGCALYWFKNDGTGCFTRYPVQLNHPKPRLERHAIGDMNGNGQQDIVIVENLTGDLYWFENNGTPDDGRLWKLHEITLGGMPHAYDVALADFNGDGRLDVAASGWLGNEIAWFEQPVKPHKGWTKHLLDETMIEARTIRAVDFTGSGSPDLLATAAGADLTAWFENPGGDGAGAWRKHTIDDGVARPIHGHPVDMDGDGQSGVVMACGMKKGSTSGRVVWYEHGGDPAGEWQRHTICADLPQAFEAFAADLDGDGAVEVAVTTWGVHGGLHIFKHDGDPRGPWQKKTLKENWINANQVIIADLDGDGRPDILAEAERESNELRWWRNS